MPIIQCHVDEDVGRRLQVFASLNDRETDELAASWIADAARRAIPLSCGRPIDMQQRRVWDALEPKDALEPRVGLVGLEPRVKLEH